MRSLWRRYMPGNNPAAGAVEDDLLGEGDDEVHALRLEHWKDAEGCVLQGDPLLGGKEFLSTTGRVTAR